MPFSGDRFNRLLDLKGITQQEVAAAAEIAQSQVSDCKKGICRTTELTEKLARTLDCTPDFLLGWSFAGVDDDEDAFRAAVSRMAFDAFNARIDIAVEYKDRCRRVLIHKAAPITAEGWAILAEQVKLAIGP